MRLRSTMAALAVLACVQVSPRAAHAGRRVLHDTNVIVDPTLVPDSEAVVYVEVRGATALRKSHPVDEATVKVSVRRSGAKEEDPTTELGAAETNSRGRALVRFRVPRLTAGRYQLLVETRSRHGSGTVARDIDVTESAHLHVRTDRPVYKPGQSLRWRATLVSAANAHALADSEIEIVVTDPNGTAIWRGRESTDESGMIIGEVPLGEDLVLGKYTVSASARGVRAAQTVQIKEFTLPPFDVQIRPKPGEAPTPGKTLHGTVIARYHYGEPVSGDVSIGSGRTARTGTLDADGRFAFELPVPVGAGSMQLTARVTDGAGRRRDASAELPLPSDDLRVAVIPESRSLASGRKHWVTVVTTDGAGALVPAKVSLRATDQPRIVRDSHGAVRIAVAAPEQTYSWPPFTLQAEVSTADGRVAEQTINVPLHESELVVRAKRAVVDEGSPVSVAGHWPKDSGPVVLTLVRDGAPLARAVVEPKAGTLRGSITPPPGLFGLLTVRATDLDWDRNNGAVRPRSADTTVYIRPKELDVTIHGERRHAPGDVAKLAVEVRDRAGAVVAGVALAASVVDERVLALGPTPPDLVTALRELHVGKAEAAGVAFAALLTGADTKPRRLARRAILESLPADSAPPTVIVAAAARVRTELARIADARGPLVAHLVDYGAIARRSKRARWRFRTPLDDHLAAIGWKRARRNTPWEEPTTWTYAIELDGSLALDSLAREVAELRIDKLVDALWKKRKRARGLLHRSKSAGLVALADASVIGPGLAVDPWGTPVRVERRTALAKHYIAILMAGPDARFGTADDLVREDVFRESELIGAYGTGYGYGSGHGGLGGRASRAPQVRMGAAMVSGRAEARVRKRFDETVLWVAGIRTDRRGRAELEVPLADSITGWRVDVEAVGGAGGIGAARARLETFLPVHVDAEVPAGLTVGDTYSIPVAVANHSGTAKRFAIEARVTGAASLVDGARHDVRIADGGARPAYVTVRANRPGEAVLRLSLRSGGDSIDELERRIEIGAPGQLERRLHSGRLTGGGGEISFRVPKDHARGTARATLTLFRGAADQAMDGLEGMLQEPYGCFEQTSSATYPNLLVLDLLGGRRGTEAVRKRARELVGKGYQRLISYEVSGGGFSWFGESPANQILTAYGLMEFVDMSRVYPVDDKLVDRTRKWLLGKQQSDGSWKPDPSWLHDWSAVQGKVSTTAYVAWALAETGYRGKELQRALRYLRRNSTSLAKSPYLSALWAAAEAAAGSDDDRAMAALRKAAQRDDDRLHFSAGGATLFYGTGDSADVQVTSLAAQALFRAGRGDDTERALDWLWTKRQPSYGWGTTQSTVLALRASSIAAPKETPMRGTVRVEIDGEPAGELDLASPDLPMVELDALAAGDHTIRLVGPKGVELRADVRLRWRGNTEPAATANGLAVALAAPKEAAAIGTLVDRSVTVSNPSDEQVAMPTIIVPVPPGFRADPTALDNLERSGAVSRAEDRGSEIALYLKELSPKAAVKLAYRLEATAACDVLQHPARAYAYYSPEVNGSSATHRVQIAPRE